MTSRKVRTFAVGATAVLAALAFVPTAPAGAIGTAHTGDDRGTDYDPACIVNASTAAPGPNSHTTSGCAGLSTYDGSMGGVDIASALRKCGPGEIWVPFLGLCVKIGPGYDITTVVNVADRNVPGPGSTTPFDLPSPTFNGANYYSLFQNEMAQTNEPTNPAGGCTRAGTGGPVYDQHGSWRDGHHFFTNYAISWVGGRWVHSAQVGEYLPGPDGGFTYHELGTNSGGGWVNSNPYMIKGVNWDVEVISDGDGTALRITVDGIVKTPDANCAEGYFKTAYVKAGDVISNAKAMTTANAVVRLPVAVPELPDTCALFGGMICAQQLVEDTVQLGGFVHFADTTDGASTAGRLGANIRGIAYTPGLASAGIIDTLGAGPTCPTPTFGGTLPKNPLFVPDTACHIDDDGVSRGTFLGEWWETTHGVTA